ncbi:MULTISPECIES: photosystem I protein M (PsaM) [Francisella]|uniref:Photosystem I protein M (PsaM) n=1 Tax=Francisella opportunistica TaxID=2016517 RepID=A0A345JSW8_9GAMM|nr:MULTISPECIES: photosystem I protein M (PsaM) [Francisella]APC92194.1 putative membrane protein [Francisella sp. MA067296]AXH30414.1 photosystem I protein M (PsaM) [Francisella opportunistica]AXH32054.1 photosystem I protein M (PsaM) [Francisella opportunistica]AXH33702.1 photosystem I protein M (PsaM) [Francisella opportunistica]
MSLKFSQKKLAGLTMVELLISTAIAVMILSALITTYIAVKSKYTEYKDKTTTEAKELLVKNILFNFIKDVGFACNFGSSQQTYYDRTSDSLDSFFYSPTMIRVGRLPLANSAHIPQSLEENCSAGCYQPETDYIMIKKEESHSSLTQINSLNSTLHLRSVDGITASDYLFLCNKNSINLVKASNVNSNSNTINLSQSPQGSDYYPGDYIGKYSLEILYVRDTGKQDSQGQSIYSLYVYIKNSGANGMSYELVRGVENLQVEYATVSNNVITWNNVAADIDINSSNYPALKISYSIAGQTFNKIITL